MGLTPWRCGKGSRAEKAKRYRQGSKKKKGQLIEEYMELAGMRPAIMPHGRCSSYHGVQHAGRPVKIVRLAGAAHGSAR